MHNHYPNLNPEKALIWRIVHRDNLAWIMENGLHCGNSGVTCPSWEHIGNAELTDKRATRQVPIAPYGVLNDYVPFYFTPFSPMMYNIYTGRGGVIQRSNEEIVILVSSVHRIAELGHQFIYTDRHAYVATANYYNNINKLDNVDWGLLQNRNFQRDPNDPEKVERYQAEALIYQHLPVEALIGVVCYTDSLKSTIEEQVRQRGLDLNIKTIKGWYF